MIVGAISLYTPFDVIPHRVDTRQENRIKSPDKPAPSRISPAGTGGGPFQHNYRESLIVLVIVDAIRFYYPYHEIPQHAGSSFQFQVKSADQIEPSAQTHQSLVKIRYTRALVILATAVMLSMHRELVGAASPTSRCISNKSLG